MPVLGHAVTGWATAQAVRPREAPPGHGGATAYWTAALVALAYGPDVAAQAGLAAGWADAVNACHSLVCALASGPVVGAALALLLGVRRSQAVAVALASIVLHDLLDLLQSPGREPLWPLGRWTPGEQLTVIPASGAREALLSCGVLAIWLAARRLTRPRTPGPEPLHRLANVVLVAVFVACAGGTQVLRGVRERQLEDARRLVREGRYAQALAAATSADRWPSTAHPGRVDHVRAEALEESGELEGAIAGYSRAAAADPTNFWAAADLTAACAASPRKDRRLDASALRARLRRDFPSHPALNSALVRIDERLARAAAAAGGHQP